MLILSLIKGLQSFRPRATQINLLKRCFQLSSIQLKDSASLIKRPPVVTIMGHVDHGKTTLLDYLRNSQIVKQEFGGITQHIGAFVVPFKQHESKTELVTFLDTPGHAAFASMRQRGANVTDIVVLVVACEDGVLDQTIESINYAKISRVPIIVAVNKIDKIPDEQSQDRMVKSVCDQLRVHDVIPEMDGGDVQVVKISALKGLGIESLKESILALAETLELRVELDCPMEGVVIESLVDVHRGKLCTILVQRGQLQKGDVIVAGENNWAKTRALFDERGNIQRECGPGLPIQVIGWREDQIPSAGDPVIQIGSESEARSLIMKFKADREKYKAELDAKAAESRYDEYRVLYKKKLEEKMEMRKGGVFVRRILWNTRGKREKETQEDEMADRKVNIVLKCDVDGSLEAILELLDTYDRDNKQPVKLDVMHYGVGSISDNDLDLAASFPNSIIYGFNVKFSNQKILLRAKNEGIRLKMFNVIYHLIDDLKGQISERIPEVDEEIELGRANVLQEFVVTDERKKKIRVAGSYCVSGILKHDSLYKVYRNHNELVACDLEVLSLKHHKDEVKEIKTRMDFGISFKPMAGQDGKPSQKSDQVEIKAGDILVAYTKRRFRPKLKWNLRGFD